MKTGHVAQSIHDQLFIIETFLGSVKLVICPNVSQTSRRSKHQNTPGDKAELIGNT